tara:strand:+ start:408 stop:971 length:564 start_codon:yes stop_codon:yes gene_type:complete
MYKNLIKILIVTLFTLIPNLSIASAEISKIINNYNINVIFLRHAIAPGYGDPINFKLGDCNTQRNLNFEGIEQAKMIGNYFRINKIKFSEILSSEWCRCLDTISNMDIGKWKEFEGLNSFFQNYSDKSLVTKLLYKKLNTIKDEELILMVTHQVVIAQITGISPSSGGMVLYSTLNGKSKNIVINYK